MDIYYKEVGTYLGIHLTPKEISNISVINVIPTRMKQLNGSARGVKSILTYLENNLDSKKEPN